MSLAKRRPTAFIVVLLGILALGVVAIVATSQQDGPDDDATATARVTVEGDPLPAFAGGSTDEATGMQAPEVTGRDFDGSAVRIVEDTRPKAIVFLAHWCPHCQREVGDLTAWLEDNELPKGVDLYTVSTFADPTRGNYPPDRWLSDAGWSFPVLVDDEESSVAEAFGLAGTPFWVFTAGDGTVVGRSSGALEPEQLEQLLRELAKAQ